jgi:hypothetical protein
MKPNKVIETNRVAVIANLFTTLQCLYLANEFGIYIWRSLTGH